MGLVLTLTDELQRGLARASPQRLDAVAVRWSRTLWGDPDPEATAGFLGALARLAQDARDNDWRLYCWLCV